MRGVRWVHGAGMHGAPFTPQPSPPPLQLLAHFWDLASLEEVSLQPEA